MGTDNEPMQFKRQYRGRNFAGNGASRWPLGRFDHFTFDASKKRLFVACLGADAVSFRPRCIEWEADSLPQTALNHAHEFYHLTMYTFPPGMRRGHVRWRDTRPHLDSTSPYWADLFTRKAHCRSVPQRARRKRGIQRRIPVRVM